MGMYPYNNYGFPPSGGMYPGLGGPMPAGTDGSTSGAQAFNSPFPSKGLNEPTVDSFSHSGQGKVDSEQPDMKFTDFSQLTPEAVRSQGDIKGIAFDVDDTLSEFKLGDRSIPPELKQRLKTLQDSGIKLGIISNNPNSDTALQIQKELADSGINMAVISNAEKPGTKGLDMMSQYFGVPPSQMMMVGDNKNTDMVSGNNAGVKTAQVDWFGTSTLHKEGMSLADKALSGLDKIKDFFGVGSDQPKFFPPPGGTGSPPVSATA